MARLTRRATQQGFSIIEIAVTLVVLGMLLAAAVPSIGTWTRNAKLRNQAESLQSGLQQARNEAVRRNRPITFHMVNNSTTTLGNSCALSASGSSWVVSVRSPAGACGATPTNSSTDAADPLIVASHLGADGANGVSVSGLASDNTTATDSVTFDALGRPMTFSGSGDAHRNLRRITVNYASSQTDDRPLRVDITPAGMVRFCDTTITNTSDPRRCL